ncbi:hypothetical protein [Kocuria aegyptia]|uniref:hypothetical protein n=1 Tax=Kocuria aegyptia TaxID=330943 RepID=UPI0031E3E4DE
MTTMSAVPLRKIGKASDTGNAPLAIGVPSPPKLEQKQDQLAKMREYWAWHSGCIKPTWLALAACLGMPDFPEPAAF